MVSFSVRAELPDEQRKTIYQALKAASHRASVEAEAAYPLDGTHIDTKKLATMDFKAHSIKHFKEEDRLIEKYERPIKKKYHLSDDEVDEMTAEAIEKGW